MQDPTGSKNKGSVPSYTEKTKKDVATTNPNNKKQVANLCKDAKDLVKTSLQSATNISMMKEGQKNFEFLPHHDGSFNLMANSQSQQLVAKKVADVAKRHGSSVTITQNIYPRKKQNSRKQVTSF